MADSDKKSQILVGTPILKVNLLEILKLANFSSSGPYYKHLADIADIYRKLIILVGMPILKANPLEISKLTDFILISPYT